MGNQRSRFQMSWLSITAMMDLSLKSLRKAVDIREQIDALEKRLASLFEGTAPQAAAAPAAGRSRTMSAARKKIAEARRARWAEQRSAPNSSTKRRSRGGKRPPMSEEARARLAASAKKRWAAAKRAGRSRL